MLESSITVFKSVMSVPSQYLSNTGLEETLLQISLPFVSCLFHPFVFFYLLVINFFLSWLHCKRICIYSFSLFISPGSSIGVNYCHYFSHFSILLKTRKPQLNLSIYGMPNLIPISFHFNIQ